MNDEKSSLTVLSDAFAELERRADVVTAEVAFVPPPVAHRRRWPVIAAAAAGVAAIATGATLLAQPDGHSARPVAGGHSSARTVASPAPTTTVTGPRELVPSSPEEIARRFRAVLADRDLQATFTVTDTGHAVTVTLPSASGGNAPVRVPNGRPNGAAIVGQLTAGGVTGGYDVQLLKANDIGKASCDTEAHCTLTTFADGSSLATARLQLQGGGVTYEADFVRTDGVEVLMHVSNRKDPKGAGAVLAAAPPLTTAQLRAIVTSNLWLR